ncbi:hypothetical protein BH23CHL2_BH23CHL2_27810 [soil metagenome]
MVGGPDYVTMLWSLLHHDLVALTRALFGLLLSGSSEIGIPHFAKPPFGMTRREASVVPVFAWR